MSTPLAQLPGMSQRPSGGPPPALTREQLNSVPSQLNDPQRAALGQQQMPNDGGMMRQDDDDATINEVFNHLNGEAAQRVMSQQQQQAPQQPIAMQRAPPPQQQQQMEPEPEELLYYPTQYQLPDEDEAPPTDGIAGWWRRFFGADAESKTIDIQMFVFMAVVFFAASLLPVSDLISRYLPFTVGVPNAELALRAAMAALAIVLVKRWNDGGAAR